MRGRPKRVAARDSQRRRQTPNAKDGQRGAVKVVGHQKPETADEAQPEPDVAQDGANVVETAQPGAGTAAEAVCGAA